MSRFAFVALAASAFQLAAATALAGEGIVPVPVLVPAPWVAAPYGMHCYPYAACLDRGPRLLLDRRRERQAALRADIEARAQAGVADPSKLGIPATSMPTGALSDTELQPEFRGVGAVREEFAHSGEYLPRYRDAAENAVPGAPQAVTPPRRRARPMMPCPQGRPEC